MKKTLLDILSLMYLSVDNNAYACVCGSVSKQIKGAF